MGNSKSKSLMDTVIDIKMVKKQMDSAHKRAEKESEKEKAKVKKAVEAGNVEGARIYAENAIRKKNEALNFLKLSARMDAVGSRLESAEKSQQISDSIKRSVPQLQKALVSMSPEQMANNMDTFEKIFEDLDVTTQYMTGAIDNTTTSLTPATQVDDLISAIGQEHNMNVAHMMQGRQLEKNPEANVHAVRPQGHCDPQVGNVDMELEQRLANLRG